MQTCNISILNVLGLHARAAAKFVHTAGRFTAHVTVARGEREVDGKSIMGLLLLAAAQGSSIRISADGPDEGDAIAALCALVERGFDETPPDGAAFDKAQGRPFDKPQGKPQDER
jgi:phosphocarrier protein HPr